MPMVDDLLPAMIEDDALSNAARKELGHRERIEMFQAAVTPAISRHSEAQRRHSCAQSAQRG